MQHLFKIVLMAAAILVGLSPTNAQTPQVDLFTWSTGYAFPVDIANAGDSRLFIVERDGRIQIADANGQMNPQPFLDITDRVATIFGEQGLLGLAFHPNYSNNGYFYVNYTGLNNNTYVSRFSVSTNPDTADAATESVIITIPQPYLNHNGGDLEFGPDGYLYIGMGDGGDAGDPQNHAQDSLDLLGKMLRIDVDGGSPYAIPPDNPFVGNSNYLPEIWATGLRNPWRFSFDRQTGDLWIGDVGQGAWEEIDFWPAQTPGGANFGWRCYEGNAAYDLSLCGGVGPFTYPIFEYDHNPGHCSVTGGYVYRGSLLSDLDGHYFLADFCTGNMWTVYDSVGVWATHDLGTYNAYDFSSFGEDVNGELYIAGLNTGNIYQVNRTTGITDRRNDLHFQAYPNPVQNELTVKTNAAGSTITLHDLSGRIVFEAPMNAFQKTFALPSLTDGLYFITLTANGKQAVQKLIVK